MGFWDVLLFNIASVLGPRWIAAAAHAGPSSISLWILAALFFFVPTGLVISELSTRFPNEGGLYVWSKEAFGDFHGFVAGWSYWVYTFFYFPGLLLASASMAAYVGGAAFGHLAQDRFFLLCVSFLLLFIAVGLNLVGLRVGKWLQNLGGIGTYIPLLMLITCAFAVWTMRDTATHFSFSSILPVWNWDTVNFWSQIAFAFTGLELVSAMSDEIHDPKRTIPAAILGSGVLIMFVYILGTIALLILMPAGEVDAKSGVFQALTVGFGSMGLGMMGMLAALVAAVGNAGGIGSTVAGISRIPFVVGVDRYLPAAFGKIHPRWRTPYVSILVQAGISGTILLLSQINETTTSSYQILVDAAIILYFIPFLYMYAAVIKLAYRPDRATAPRTVLVPGGKLGVWLCGGLGFLVTLASIIFSMVPPGETADKVLFEVKLLGGSGLVILIGLFLYWNGARAKRQEVFIRESMEREARNRESRISIRRSRIADRDRDSE